MPKCKTCSNYWHKDWSINYECRLGHSTPDLGDTDACDDYEEQITILGYPSGWGSEKDESSREERNTHLNEKTSYSNTSSYSSSGSYSPSYSKGISILSVLKFIGFFPVLILACFGHLALIGGGILFLIGSLEGKGDFFFVGLGLLIFGISSVLLYERLYD